MAICYYQTTRVSRADRAIVDTILINLALLYLPPSRERAAPFTGLYPGVTSLGNLLVSDLLYLPVSGGESTRWIVCLSAHVKKHDVITKDQSKLGKNKGLKYLPTSRTETSLISAGFNPTEGIRFNWIVVTEFL